MPATQDMFTLRRLDWKSIYEDKLENIDNLEIHRMVVMNNFVILAIASKTLSTIIFLQEPGKKLDRLFKVTQYEALVCEANRE